jgi:hypothetical protein
MLLAVSKLPASKKWVAFFVAFVTAGVAIDFVPIPMPHRRVGNVIGTVAFFLLLLLPLWMRSRRTKPDR